jgi:hypothetical protein
MAECGKCGGAQETGFTLDEGYGTRGPAQWRGRAAAQHLDGD